MKTVKIKDFVELGFLQELNRQFLHPAGMALSVQVDDEGTYTFGRVWDCRDDPEGLIYVKGVLDKSKEVEYKKLHDSKFMTRQSKFGWSVQPSDD